MKVWRSNLFMNWRQGREWMFEPLPWWVVLPYWAWEIGWFLVTVYALFHVESIGQNRAFFLILTGAGMIAIGYFVIIWVAFRRRT